MTREQAFSTLLERKRKASAMYFFAGTPDKVPLRPTGAPVRVKEIRGNPVLTAVVLSSETGGEFGIDLSGAEFDERPNLLELWDSEWPWVLHIRLPGGSYVLAEQAPSRVL